MNPEAQRIAIARACGLSEIGWMDETLMHAGTGTFLDVPDYLNDLNAMHEAEKVLTGSGQQIKYGNELIAICDRDAENRNDKKWKATTMHILHATAAQRAEAFLKTLDKWEK